MLEDYFNVKTGQDLIDLGVVPKDSPSHLSLISFRRLDALRNIALKNANAEMLGKWIPVLEKRGIEITGDELQPALKPGARVIGTGRYEDNELTGLEGTFIHFDSKGRAGVEWDKLIPNGHDLSGTCKKGYGWYVSPSTIKMSVEGYSLTTGVVADKKLGHKVRLNEQFTFTKTKKSGYETQKINVNVPKGTIATLVGFNKGNGNMEINVESGDAKGTYTITNPEDCSKYVEASSLGQLAPLDLETEVRKQALSGFFPSTYLETETAEKIILGILMGKEVVFYGLPGAGKSNVARDIVEVAKQKQIAFVVEGCKVQCNPFSLFDEKFAKVVPPCPACMIEYDDNFKVTGRFTKRRPKDVKVIVAKFGEGFGIEKVEGTVGLNRMHLVGFKMPKLDGTTTEGRESDYDPEGFHPGHLPRTNNGILIMEELDKLRPQALDNLLEAEEAEKVYPDQLRFSYPANNVIIGTANETSGFSGAIKDRSLFFIIRYPTDTDIGENITRRSYHNEISEADDVPVGDTHKEKAFNLREIPMPVIIENAANALYIKFREEYAGEGKTDISASNRSLIDALDASRAKLTLDQLFFQDTPVTVTSKYARFGIEFAMHSRAEEPNNSKDGKKIKEISDWIEKEFPSLLKGEEDTWWCKAYKHISISKTQIPEIESNFIEELKVYKENPQSAISSYEEIKYSRANPDNLKAQKARIKYPFIDYLFNEQPHFDKVNETQLLELTNYFMESRQNTTCTIGTSEKTEKK
ncbi:hypothetical protein HZA33_00345 [Candidatus Pacearchaeota archaeon]|nr:hypothetical protein [Candidatus Pacearchaeota archaeon]